MTDSNSAGRPVGINQLWGDDGNDTLEAIHSTDGRNAVTDVTSYLDGGKGNDNLTADIHRAWWICSLPSINSKAAMEKTSSRQISTLKLRRGLVGLDFYNVANVLNGGAGDDQLTAFLSAIQHGSDQAYTDNSIAENRLDGGAGNDVLTATVASGSLGSSFLSGGAGNDQLTVFGGSANVLDGGDGKDTLTSGIGNDSMFGGDGADTLVFAAQNGHDTAEFEPGRDIIDLTALAANNIHDFGDLNIKPAGANTVIQQ